MIKGEFKTEVIYEDENTFAFLDIRPAAKQGGHTLVIPKKHYELLTDIPDDELAALIKTVKKVTKALLKFSEGVNVLQNNKAAAGQFIFHAHFHLIPRFKNDNIIVEKWDSHEYKEGEMEKVCNKIKTLLKES